MDISHTLAHHARVKHSDVDQNFIKEKIDTGIVTDLLTKDLLMASFLQLISLITSLKTVEVNLTKYCIEEA